jgi:adenine phosphoribosyltransferase
VLIVDDLLATGGTALATCQLVEKLGGVVSGVAFVVELDFLKGRDKLAKYDIFSVLRYDK